MSLLFHPNFRILWFITVCALVACQPSANIYRLTKNYKPDNQALFDTISKLDSIFFHYYNTCDKNLALHCSFYSDSIEFYHDKGGLMQSKADLKAALQKNVCGKVTRHLVKGSLEVYPIGNFSAIEIGLHGFRNNQESFVKHPKTGRFMMIWKLTPAGYKVTRVISLH